MEGKEVSGKHYEAVINGTIDGLKGYLDLMKKYPTELDKKKVLEINSQIEILNKVLTDVKKYI